MAPANQPLTSPTHLLSSEAATRVEAMLARYRPRIIDGLEAVTILVRVKEAIEDPTRLLIDL